MSSDAKLGDGFNPHFAIIDEYHALPDNNIPDVLQSGMGMRQNPMMIYITTAGFNIMGPCKEYRDMCEDILKGKKTDDSIFPLIYELDEGDDWIDSKCWKKACPSLDITVSSDYLAQQINLAKNNTSMEVGVRTKNLNQWVSSSCTWLSDDYIRGCMAKVPDSVYSGQCAWIGLDLAAVSDLAAWSALLEPDPNRKFHPDKYIFKSWCYLPSSELKGNVNWVKYRSWKEKGLLTVTDGNVTDFDKIHDDIFDFNKNCSINSIAYDAWQSTLLITHLTQDGIQCDPYSQGIGNFTKAVKTFEMLVRSNRVIIDNSLITRWCFSNVVLKEDNNENVKPTKNSRPQKIDIVVAMLQALGMFLSQSGTDIDVV